MTIHYLDILIYFILLIIFYLLAPRQAKEEMGIFIFLVFAVIFSVFYVIIFGIIDYNWADIFKSIHLPKITA